MLPATWDFEIRIQKVICYAFLSCPVSAFLMIGVLPASTQLPAFSLKSKHQGETKGYGEKTCHRKKSN